MQPRSHAKLMRKLVTLVFANTFLAALLFPLTSAARLPIEEVQREFQARYYFINGSYVQWPACSCQTPAPAFPADGFYGDLDHNPVFAVQLVQDLANQFYGTVLYQNFLNTPDGITGIKDQVNQPANYQQGDVSPIVDGIDMSSPGSIDSSNFTNCFQVLRGYIEKLNYVSCGADAVDAAWRGGTGTTNSAGGCSGAKTQASCRLGQRDLD